MATSLLALLDDITTILDDVSVMTKVAAKKTAGVLGDDLALNAEQVSGVRADRELAVVWAVALKKSDGFARGGWTAAFVAALAVSMALLARAMRELPAGTAYAVWTGIGAAGAALMGIAFLGEPAGWPRLACLALVVAGIVGLKVVTPG